MWHSDNNPLGTRLSPIWSERSVTYVSRTYMIVVGETEGFEPRLFAGCKHPFLALSLIPINGTLEFFGRAIFPRGFPPISDKQRRLRIPDTQPRRFGSKLSQWAGTRLFNCGYHINSEIERILKSANSYNTEFETMCDIKHEN